MKLFADATYRWRSEGRRRAASPKRNNSSKHTKRRAKIFGPPHLHCLYDTFTQLLADMPSTVFTTKPRARLTDKSAWAVEAGGVAVVGIRVVSIRSLLERRGRDCARCSDCPARDCTSRTDSAANDTCRDLTGPEPGVAPIPVVAAIVRVTVVTSRMDARAMMDLILRERRRCHRSRDNRRSCQHFHSCH